MKEEKGKIIEVSEEIYDAYQGLIEIRTALETLNADKENLESQMKEAFGDAESITFKGQLLATYKTPKETLYFDAKKFQEDHPDLAKEYMRAKNMSRRFTLK